MVEQACVTHIRLSVNVSIAQHHRNSHNWLCGVLSGDCFGVPLFSTLCFINGGLT